MELCVSMHIIERGEVVRISEGVRNRIISFSFELTYTVKQNTFAYCFCDDDGGADIGRE